MSTINSTVSVDDETFFGIMQTGYTMDESAIEVGLYFVLSSVCMFFLLDEVRGKPRKLRIWATNRKLDIFQESKRNSTPARNLLLAVGHFYAYTPFVILLSWAILMWYDQESVKAPICILGVGLSLLTFSYHVMKVKWSNYRFKVCNIVAILASILTISVYQTIIIFTYEHEEIFFPYSAFLLKFNVLCLSFLVFFSKYTGNEDMLNLLMTYFPRKGVRTADRMRDNEIQDEIIANMEDPEWEPSYEELTDIITISRVSMQKFMSAVGGGFVQRFNKQPEAFKRLIKSIVLGISLAILFAYALTIYLVDDKSKMGMVTAASVIFMDIYTFLLNQSQMVDAPTSIVFLLVLNRSLMIGLGSSHWIYGYMILYLVYALTFAYHIARNRFPFEDDVVLRSSRIDALFKAEGKLRAETSKKKKLELVADKIQSQTSPEFLLGVLSVLFFLLMLIVSASNLKGVDPSPFIMASGTPHAVEIHYLLVAFLSVLLVLTFYVLVALVRISVRKAKWSGFYDNAKMATKVISKFRRNQFLSLLSFYEIFAFTACSGWGGFFWGIYKNGYFFIAGMFGSGCLICFSRAFTYFALNDFNYFQDVTKLNQRIDRHNQRIDEFEKRKAQIQQQLVDGTLLLPPVPAPKPVKPTGIFSDASSREATQQDSENGRQSPGPDKSFQAFIQKKEQVDQPPEPVSPARLKPSEGKKGLDDLSPQRRDELAQRQKELVARLIEQEKEKNKKAKTDRRKSLEADANLKLREELEKKAMEQQLEREKREKEKRARQAALEKKRKAEELRIKQHIEDETRRREEAARKNEAASKAKNSVYNFSGKMEEVKVVNRKKGFKDDEMYEGGELLFEGGVSRAIQNSKVYLDLDSTEKLEDGMTRIASHRLRRVPDWRMRFSSFMKAYEIGAIRPNDLEFLKAVLGSFIFFMCQFFASGLWGGFGAMIAQLPLFYILVCFLIASTVTYQSRNFHRREMITWVTLNVVFFFIGLIYFLSAYDFVDFIKGDSHDRAGLFFYLYLVCAPTAAHGLLVLLQVIDRGIEDLSVQTRRFTIAFFVFLGVTLLSCFLFFSWYIALATLGAFALLVYVAFQAYKYIQQDYYVTPKWDVANKVLTAVCVLFTAIFSWLTDELSVYEGVSYSIFALLAVFWFFAIFQFVRDSFEKEKRPVFYSSTILPIYKFNPKTNDIEPHYDPAIAWIIGLIILMGYGFYTNLQIYPMWMGAVLTIFIEMLVLLSLIYLRSVTLDSLKNAHDFLSKENIKSSWLAAKLQYFKAKGAFSRLELQTYRRQWVRRWFINNLLAVLQTGKGAKMPGWLSREVKAEVEVDPADLKEDYIDRVMEFEPNIGLKLIDLENLCFKYDKIVSRAYLDEVEQVIQFVMTVVQNSLILRAQEQKEFIRFLTSKQDVLQALGIFITIPKKGSLNTRYDMVMNQIEQLTDEEREFFVQLQQLYETEKEKRLEESKKVYQQEQRRNLERLEMTEKLRQKKEEELIALQSKMEGIADIAINMDIDSMPDCRLKYQIIVKRAQAGRGKFVDSQFKAENSSLGDLCLQKTKLGGGDYEWKRVGDINPKDGLAYSVFQDGAEFNDIQQGALGDCYFLSAMAVLGNSQIRDKFIFLNTDDEWMESGAFCIKFYNSGKEDIVIVDDHFLFWKDTTDFCYAKTPSGKELWPSVLEKAYAKKYGSYSMIDGGFIHAALSDLTNGVPESFKLRTIQNQAKLWDQLIKLQREKTFLGAGSPPHPDGDQAKSPEGIVQGHAYSILRLIEVDGIKLIKLRNPWGYGEWTGDWSDESELWTQRIMNFANYSDMDTEDGVFWMDFSDFMEEFAEVYACRNYTKQTGWSELTIEDEWAGDYAEGLPSQKNRRAEMKKNPQYGITVYKPGKGFFVLRLKERSKESAALTQQSGYLNIQKIDGGLITGPSKVNQLSTLGPSNKAVQACEVDFPSSLAYPYTFSILVANMNHGREGEGHFTVQVYSRDKRMEAEKLN